MALSIITRCRAKLLSRRNVSQPVSIRRPLSCFALPAVLLQMPLATPSVAGSRLASAAIYIDIRPWGSMSTIVAHQFLQLRIKPDVPLAGMLLCAILSDTLNLLGPTTTEWDRTMVALLAEICSVGASATLRFKCALRLSRSIYTSRAKFSHLASVLPMLCR